MDSLRASSDYSKNVLCTIGPLVVVGPPDKQYAPGYSLRDRDTGECLTVNCLEPAAVAEARKSFNRRFGSKYDPDVIRASFDALRAFVQAFSIQTSRGQNAFFTTR
jgi:hypothetical protein